MIMKFRQIIMERGTSDPNAAERGALETFQKQLDSAKKKHGLSSLTLYSGNSNKSFQAHHVEKVPGTPKADFVIKDENNNPTHFISHKAGSSPKDFQQYGGISQHTEHPVVKSFVKAIKRQFPNGVHGQTAAMHLDMKNPQHKELAGKMVFGNDHGTTKEHGVNNVSALYQGHFHLRQHENGIKGHYRLQATNIHHNGDIPGSPVIYARGGDRNDAGLKGTRVGVGDSTSRKITTTIPTPK